MKNRVNWVVCLCVLFMGTSEVFAQQEVTKPKTKKATKIMKVDKSNLKVQRHTVMERFEPEMVVSANQRLEKKQQRAEDTERKIDILDTLDISERRKRKLLLDLKYTPYSNRLNKAVLVDTEFEDDTSGNNDDNE